MSSGHFTQKVLFVDDEDKTFRSLKPHLEGKGLSLFHASNGKEGERVIDSEKPHLVVTDVIMPKMNGFELIRTVKSKRHKQTKFIVLTNYGSKEISRDKGLLASLGICKYLLKSNHTPKELIREIENALAQ